MNKAQELQYERMKLASFNGFDGEVIGQKLRDHQDLWTAFVFGRFDGSYSLIELRDLSEDYINADTLVILPAEGKEQELELLAAKEFNADEVDYYEPYLSAQGGGSVVPLRVWWD